MSIIKRRKTTQYTQINNGCLQDSNLTSRAKGIIAYLMSLPEDWKVYKTYLHKDFRDGRDSVKKGFNELIENGYAMERKYRDQGKFVFEYMVSDIKFTDEEKEEYQREVTVTEIPSRCYRNGKHVSTKEIGKKKLNKSKYVSNAFTLYESNFETTKQTKKAIQSLEDTHGEFLALEAIKRAIKCDPDNPLGHIRGTLSKWAKDNVTTVEDIESYEARHREKSVKKTPPRGEYSKVTPSSKPVREEKLPKSIQKQLESPTVKVEQDPDSINKNRARIQAALGIMNEKLLAK